MLRLDSGLSGSFESEGSATSMLAGLEANVFEMKIHSKRNYRVFLSAPL
jgi:hypothetical protein